VNRSRLRRRVVAEWRYDRRCEEELGGVPFAGYAATR
jgi:hypothetical protein